LSYHVACAAYVKNRSWNTWSKRIRVAMCHRTTASNQCPRQESNLIYDLRTVACLRHTPRTIRKRKGDSRK